MLILAEQDGFEPSKRYNRLPDFESYAHILRMPPHRACARSDWCRNCLDCAPSGKFPPPHLGCPEAGAVAAHQARAGCERDDRA